ncbi:MAG: carboxypeptidase-like regulatory domain-containing protein, partial [Muribaculaceae bacterium]|nr:carboxypeptidase-like regulatory domain-containing protein [Muribaculaceae bacterium]
MKNFLTWMILALVSLGAYAQNQTIRGTVLSKTDGEPLIGATVIPVNNPSSGTATDIDGNFVIKAAEGDNLKVSYVGYTPVVVPAKDGMVVEMSEDNAVLDELVVVGYQTVRKADLTGSVSVMNMKEPLSENSGNIMNSMAGKLPGVN